MAELRDDEIEFLGTARCKICHHLSSLHNEHCCVYCMVEGCDCAWEWWLDDENPYEPGDSVG